MSRDFDIAIVGSGFGGSLLAMIARQLGRSVVLIERGRHPRFAIGESSTPLANLILEQLAGRYRLDGLAQLTKWGTWQGTHPEIACGLKRGFTFYHHRPGQRWAPQPDRGNELLVAASPNDAIADTHWYRADFDHFLVQEAQRLGVEYLDETQLVSAEMVAGGSVLNGVRDGQELSIRARWVVDATGPRGFVHRALGLGERAIQSMPKTEALFTHFTGVKRWGEMHRAEEQPPYPVDDAAVHHVFPSGWIWMLRFNNGITSAGVAATDAVARRCEFGRGAAGWERLLDELPDVAAQFADASPVQPFVHSRALSFLAREVTGPGWALLPSSAGFVDPLLSSGFPLTLLGIERLARMIECDWGTERFDAALESYAQQTIRELEITAELVGALYSSMQDFEQFAAVTTLYFAAAMTAETRRRLGAGGSEGDEGPAFLLENDPVFGPALRQCLANCHESGGKSRRARLEAIRSAIEPVNLARLGDPKRRNWYPCLAQDLLDAVPKIGVERATIEALLARCGFAGTTRVS